MDNRYVKDDMKSAVAISNAGAWCVGCLMCGCSESNVWIYTLHGSAVTLKCTNEACGIMQLEGSRLDEVNFDEQEVW